MKALRVVRELVTIVGLVAPFVYLAVRVRSLPARIAIHFDFAGHPNGFGSRETLFVMPAIALLLYVFLHVIQRLPRTFNLPVSPGAPARACYEQATVEFIAWLRLELVWTFAIASWLEVRFAEGHRTGILLPLIPVQTLILAGTIVGFLVYARRRCGGTI